VTAAEKAKMRPLVDVVLAAYRSGDFTRVCAVWSQRVVQEFFGTRARCRSEAARVSRRRCGTCSFRVERVQGMFVTAADKRLGRKLVAWLVSVRGDPEFKRESGLELRFVQERGRWMLAKVLQDG
jgi:hypothetical protein